MTLSVPNLKSVGECVIMAGSARVENIRVRSVEYDKDGNYKVVAVITGNKKDNETNKRNKRGMDTGLEGQFKPAEIRTGEDTPKLSDD